MQQWLTLYNEYSASMTLVTGLNDRDLIVFFYLFGKKVFDQQPRHSAHAICSGINSTLTSCVSLLIPVEGISDSDCSKALDKLVEYGFVRRTRPKDKRKAASEEGGRPPSFVYETMEVVEIIQRILDEIELKKGKFLKMLNGLRQLEEEAGLGQRR